MRSRSLLLFVAFVATNWTILAQDPSGKIEELEARLAQVLADQARLARENDELKTRMTSLSAAQEDLRAAAADARSAAEGDRLEEHVHALVERYANTTVTSAAEGVTLTGELRFRTVWAAVEPAGGGDAEGHWTDARARLGFGYQFAEKVSAQVDLQSHWAYGDGVSSNGNTPFGPFVFGEVSTAVDLYQAFIQVEDLFGQEGFRGRFGRQEVVLGNQFQFGNAEWYAGWVFDGFRFDYGRDSWNVTALAMKLGSADLDVNQLHSAFGSHDDDELLALYATFELAENHTLDAYWIYVNGHGGAGSGSTVGSLGTSVGGAGLAGGTTSYHHTLGGRLAGKFELADGLDYNVEGAVQFGSVNGSATTSDVFGWTVEAEVGLTFDADSAFRVFVRFLYASGPDGDDSGYVPLYPNRHANSGFLARYGLLDALPMINVISPQIGFYFKPADAWLMGATFVYSVADEELVAGNDGWGWELDFWAAYNHSKNLTFIFAAFAVQPEDQLQGLAGIDDDTIFGVVFQARLTF